MRKLWQVSRFWNSLLVERNVCRYFYFTVCVKISCLSLTQKRRCVGATLHWLVPACESQLLCFENQCLTVGSLKSAMEGVFRLQKSEKKNNHKSVSSPLRQPVVKHCLTHHCLNSNSSDEMKPLRRLCKVKKEGIGISLVSSG